MQMLLRGGRVAEIAERYVLGSAMLAGIANSSGVANVTVVRATDTVVAF